MSIQLKKNIHYVILVVLCLVAFFLRSYAIYRDMFFGYDQGRDAFEMQRIAKGDFTLIGPVTGLDGVFLGPFWYYLIFPAYWIGGWNPVASAYEMIFFAVGTVILLYLWGKKIGLPWAGLIAGTLYTFSFQNIVFSRWAANPTPLPFFALLAFYLLYHALEQKKARWFFLSGIVFGLCFQLEAANAVWFVPTVFLILVAHVLADPSIGGKTLLLSLKKSRSYRFIVFTGCMILLGFLVAELPHILFEIRHNFLITRNAIQALETTRDVSVWESLPRRIPLLFSLYGRALLAQYSSVFLIISAATLVVFWKARKIFEQNNGVRILAIWFLVPLFFHTIFTGNHGNFWDYYVIAQHPVLYLLLGISFVLLYTKLRIKKWVACVYIGGVVLLSMGANFIKWTEILLPYEDRYSLEMIVKEANWMIDQSNGTPYGVWVYSPNAQDDPHRYIYWWVGSQRGIYPQEHVEQQPLIFLAVEDDPIFWKRHREWLEEKLTFGNIVDSKKFGAITVYELQNTFHVKNN